MRDITNISPIAVDKDQEEKDIDVKQLLSSLVCKQNTINHNKTQELEKKLSCLQEEVKHLLKNKGATREDDYDIENVTRGHKHIIEMQQD